MSNNIKIIGGILFLFSGFYVLIQTIDNTRFFGLGLMAIGLYLILSNFK